MVADKGLISTGPNVSGILVRGVSASRGVRRETFILGTKERPLSFYAQLIAGSGHAPAQVVETFRIPAQSKREPAVVYATSRPEDVEDLVDRFGQYADAHGPERCDEDFAGYVPGRRRELEMCARGFRLDPSEDPWFDADRCVCLTRLWVLETSGEARVLRLYIAPVSESSMPSVESRALLDNLHMQSPWKSFRPFGLGLANAFEIPGDGMPLFTFTEPIRD